MPFDAPKSVSNHERCSVSAAALESHNRPVMIVDVLTLFPDIFAGYLGQSILKAAVDRGLVDVRLHQLRDWGVGKHRMVDDRPFGGGPGMVLKVEPVVTAVEEIQASEPAAHLILLSPRGRKLTQSVVEELASRERLLIVCGRYEGFDQRVIDLLEPDELSIGDYILGGGETAAMVVIDAVARLIPGVIGDQESHKQDSFSGEQRWLEYAQYTRPREFRGRLVPDVLLRGDHGEIASWRQQQSFDETQKRRSDLIPSRQQNQHSSADVAPQLDAGPTKSPLSHD